MPSLGDRSFPVRFSGAEAGVYLENELVSPKQIRVTSDQCLGKIASALNKELLAPYVLTVLQQDTTELSKQSGSFGRGIRGFGKIFKEFYL